MTDKPIDWSKRPLRVIDWSKRPLRVKGKPIPKDILDGPPGDFARYCGETDPKVLALLDAEDTPEERLQTCIVCRKPWPNGYKEDRVHVVCAIRWYSSWYWTKLKHRVRHG